VEQGLYESGVLLEEISATEPDAGLGNGGLGRLAACFLDSCATLQLPVKGYGLRYEYGMFRQLIENGYQVEEPDHWLRDGNPGSWSAPSTPSASSSAGAPSFTGTHAGAPGALGGHPRRAGGPLRHPRSRVPQRHHQHPAPVEGRRHRRVRPRRVQRRQLSGIGGPKNAAEHITMVLYPNDASESGKELRLRQQYFLASASIKDVLREWIRLNGRDFSRFAEKNCFQLNDTHPAISVAELMRQLVDEQHLEWDEAWDITTRTMAYTNHTLLPEALERWPVRLFEQLLPRPLQIIYEINARFLSPGGQPLARRQRAPARMSLIEEGHDPQVRMAYLAIVGSFSVNGVAALHSRLLVEGLFRDFYELWPHKFNNKTNGVTPGAGWPCATPGCASCSTRPSATAGCGTSPSSRASPPTRRTRASASAGTPSSRPTSSTWPTRSPGSATWTSPWRPCSTCRSSASTSTSASC
jgi:glycogen phosphorylase